MLAGNALTDFTSMFSTCDYENNDDIFWVISKMNEIDKANLTNQTESRLNEHYFNLKINQKKLCSKKITKYVAAFDYIDKVLIILSATSGGIFVFSVSVVGAPVGIAGQVLL